MRRHSLSVIPQTLLLYGLPAQGDARLPRRSGSGAPARQLQRLPAALRDRAGPQSSRPQPPSLQPVPPAPSVSPTRDGAPRGDTLRCPKAAAGPAMGKALLSLCTPDAPLTAPTPGKIIFCNLSAACAVLKRVNFPPGVGLARLAPAAAHFPTCQQKSCAGYGRRRGGTGRGER